MIGDRHRIPRFQSDFYRDSYYKMLRILLLTMGIVIVLIAAIIYIVLFPSPPNYYASTTTGQTILLKPYQLKSAMHVGSASFSQTQRKKFYVHPGFFILW